MAVSQVYTAVSGDIITALRWNNEFGNIINNGTDVAFPLTKAVAGGDQSVTNWGDHTMATGSIFTMTAGSMRWAKGVDLASAATVTLGSDGNYFDITGTAAISAFAMTQAGQVFITQFDAATPLIHNAASFILPGAANITTTAGSIAIWMAESSTNARCLVYHVAGAPPIPAVGANGTVLTADSTTTPGTAWSDAAVFTTGDVKLTIKTVADTGWVLMNDGTIGNAASGGTTRANADTAALFTLLWNNTANAQCAVSTGRGANAAADYAANKTIALPKALGRALATYGAGSGLTSRVLALTTGVETHVLSTAELAAHTHVEVGEFSSAGAANGIGGNTASTVPGTSTAFSTGSTGSGTAHQNMQPTLFLNIMMKL